MQHFSSPEGGYLSWDGYEQGTEYTSRDCSPVHVHDTYLDPATLKIVAPADPDQEFAQGGWRNKLARAYMRSLGVPTVETWDKNYLLWKYHKGFNPDLNVTDCTHYCHPSAPQSWVWDISLRLASYFGSGEANGNRTRGGTDGGQEDLCQQMLDTWLPAQAMPSPSPQQPLDHTQALDS